MLTHRIFNDYFQYLKSLFTLILIPAYNILKKYIITDLIRDGLSKNNLSREFV